ncbi:MAG: acyl carrier protein [Clostridiales Family XIII bacterium]|jgi:acyl carrier protein|nr:acyl carrier protein [Clostridiales Family XIII bacterium]
MSVYDRLVRILLVYAEEHKGTIEPDTDLLTDLGLNSFDLSQIVYDIEREFGVVYMFENVDFRSLRRMGDLADFVGEKAQEKI